MSKPMPVSNEEAIHAMNTIISYCRSSRDACYNPKLAGGFGFCNFLDETELQSRIQQIDDPALEERSDNLKQDMVNHPPHYQMAGGLEVIDFIEAAVASMAGPEAYAAGNVLKYVCRYRQKGGAESLKKARWYLDRLIKLKEGQNERVNS